MTPARRQLDNPCNHFIHKYSRPIADRQTENCKEKTIHRSKDLKM